MDNMPPEYNYNHSGNVKQPEIIVAHWEDGIANKLREYLRLGSCDGRVERKALRKELAKLIGAEYDERKAAIK